MGKVKQQLDSRDFSSIPRFREIIKTLPREIRICLRHGEEVDIKLGEPLLNQGGGIPFAEAYWEGCCDEVIDRVREGVPKTLETH
ncbi:MAG: hypothetical protein M3R52_05170 [Acidobacteriota bacterium]|nr:hypothetical protein [Acidobacteriota bacterium]